MASPRPEAERRELGVGAVVANYRLTTEIGAGATSEVFLGEHLTIGRPVAVKALRAALHAHPEVVRRFVGEARATHLVRHSNIVEIFDIGRFDGWQHYIVMEQLRGAPLTPLIRAGPMTLERAVPILLQVCDALNAAHARGVVHCDLKPQNIYLVTEGDRATAKIMDFGVARVSADELDDQTGGSAVVGTALYMAPEQADGRAIDGRADIYALGVIMYEMATGRLPFDAPDPATLRTAHSAKRPLEPRAVNPAVPAAWEYVILKCLAKSPADRYRSMSHLGRALNLALRDPSARPTFMQSPSASDRPFAPRFVASIDASVDTDQGPLPGPLVATDISTGGVFVATTASAQLPPVFSRVRVTLGRPSPVVVAGDVVRIEDSGAGAWRRGFGVRFDPLESAQREAVEALIGEIAPTPDSDDGGDPDAARLIVHLEARAADDYYALLGLSPTVDTRTAREACQRLALQMDPTRYARLNERQRERLVALHQSVAEAEEVLADPVRRAAYDAARGNFIGVARCLGDGLPIAELHRLRSEYLSSRLRVAQEAERHAAAADAAETRGSADAAQEALGRALRYDPLNLALQRRFWNLRRQIIDGAEAFP